MQAENLENPDKLEQLAAILRRSSAENIYLENVREVWIKEINSQLKLGARCLFNQVSIRIDFLRNLTGGQVKDSDVSFLVSGIIEESKKAGFPDESVSFDPDDSRLIYNLQNLD